MESRNVPTALSSRFFSGLALQITKEDDQSVLVRQPAQLFVEQGLQITPEVLILYARLGHRRHLTFPLLPFGGCRPCFQRRLVSHAIQPVTQVQAINLGVKRRFSSIFSRFQVSNMPVAQ